MKTHIFCLQVSDLVSDSSTLVTRDHHNKSYQFIKHKPIAQNKINLKSLFSKDCPSIEVPLVNIQVSPLELVLKKLRRIHHLHVLLVDPTACSVKYFSIGEAADVNARTGKEISFCYVGKLSPDKALPFSQLKCDSKITLR